MMGISIKSRRNLFNVLLLAAGGVAVGAIAVAQADTLEHGTAWIGNSYGNRSNQWLQRQTHAMALGENGTIYAHTTWDEAGRCLGAYRNGTVDRRMFQQYDGRGGHKAWGWGTAGRSVAVSPEHVFIINNRQDLIRFHRDNHSFDQESKIDFQPGNMAWHQHRLLILDRENPTVYLYDARSLEKIGQRQISGGERPFDIAVDGHNRVWLSYPGEAVVVAHDLNMTPLDLRIEDAGRPAAIHLGYDGRLAVSDTGPRSQVRIYQLTEQGAEIDAVFGAEGGLRAEPAGVVAGHPEKVFALRGAATDAEGNLYVAMSDHMNILRKYTAARALAWELVTTCFVDAAEADAASDGEVIYGRDAIYHYDYEEADPAQAWSLYALTRDLQAGTDDIRIGRDGKSATNAWVREVDGRKILYTTGMHAGLIHVLPFDDPADSTFARDHGQTVGNGWALYVDDKGDPWSASNGEIRRHPVAGLDGDRVVFADPETRAYPEVFRSVNRLVYQLDNDRMFLAGFTRDNPDPGGAWGLVGTEVLRYDNWSKEPQLTTRIELPFKTWEGGASNAMVMPKAMDVAGDYLFVVYVWEDGESGTNPAVRVYNVDSGEFVGNFRPGPEIGRRHGWVDIPYALSAMRRADGEYVVLVEEDGFAKITMYRWRPEGE